MTATDSKSPSNSSTNWFGFDTIRLLPTVAVTLTSEPEDGFMLVATKDISGTTRFTTPATSYFAAGASATVIAGQRDGYRFVKWVINGVEYTTDVVTFTVPASACNAHAVYEAVSSRTEYPYYLFTLDSDPPVPPSLFNSTDNLWEEGELWGTNPAANMVYPMLMHNMNETVPTIGLAKTFTNGRYNVKLHWFKHDIQHRTAPVTVE